MLNRANRLTRSQDIARLFSVGTFFGGSILQIKVWKIDEQTFPHRDFQLTDLKFAVIVGTKVDKRAVVRNRIKRQIREILRLALLDHQLQSGYLVAVMASPNAKDRTTEELTTELHTLFRRARLFV